MPKKTTTKKTVKAAPKKTVAKKAVAKKVTTKKTAPKKAVKIDKHSEAAYFWGGLAIALCAAGAFMVLAFGIGSMIR